MKPLLISSGEPAGIGPELCLALAGSEIPLVILGDQQVLRERADQLGKKIELIEYQSSSIDYANPNQLVIYPIPCLSKPNPGTLNVNNAPYVVSLLETAVKACLAGEFSAIVTAPIHKSIINDYGIKFSGHTEFLANACKVDTVVMMLACPSMKVALVTTHLPLKDVANSITKEKLQVTLGILNEALKNQFGIAQPKIAIAGLNPHAGESGYLGREEIDIISPVIESLKMKGMKLIGPLPADTMFKPNSDYDAYLAMYHDQGLPVIKYAGFGTAVNVTLGLPIIRTSVDHGTALEIAGKGIADPGSMIEAVNMAAKMVNNKE